MNLQQLLAAFQAAGVAKFNAAANLGMAQTAYANASQAYDNALMSLAAAIIATLTPPATTPPATTPGATDSVRPLDAAALRSLLETALAGKR